MPMLREWIDEHIKLSKKWIAEGKFNCHAEMVFAQNLQALNELYEKRRYEL